MSQNTDYLKLAICEISIMDVHFNTDQNRWGMFPLIVESMGSRIKAERGSDTNTVYIVSMHRTYLYTHLQNALEIQSLETKSTDWKVG